MKKQLLLAKILLFFVIFGYGQNLQNQNWVYSASGGLNFATNPPTVTTFPNVQPPPSGSNIPNYLEGCATVSDQNGNLILFSDGVRLWRKTGTTFTLVTNQLRGGYSSTQNVLFIPKPGNPNSYFVVTINGLTNIDKLGLYYSEVNVATGSLTGLNTPLRTGAIYDAGFNLITSSVLIDATFANISESITSTIDANGKDYWLVAHVQNNTFGAILSFKASCTGISITPSKYKVFTLPANDIGHTLKISPKVTPTTAQKIAFTDNGSIFLGAFDNATGAVTISTTVDTVLNNSTTMASAYGAEFSPDGTKLYFSNGNSQITGVDTNNVATQVTITNSNYTEAALQLGQDGNIYVNDLANLSVIYNPNTLTAGSLTVLSSNTGTIGLPQWIHWQQSPSTTLVAQNDAFNFCNFTSTTTSTNTILQANPTTADTSNGSVITSLTGYTLTQMGAVTPTPTAGGITLNANGTITVTTGTPSGTYQLSYQLCPTGTCPNCSNIATVTVNVETPIVLVAKPDTITKDCPIIGKYKPNVLMSNPDTAGTPDTRNGIGFDVLDASLEISVVQVSTDNPQININSAGTLVFTGTLAPGTYHLTYYILDTSSCVTSQSNTTTVTFVFNGPPTQTIVSNVDSFCFTTAGGTSTTTVLANDTLGSSTATTSSVVITQLSSSSPNVNLNTSTGKVTVASGTPMGTYDITYKICQNCVATNCSNVTKISVNVKGIQAANDSFTFYNDGVYVSPTPFTPSVLSNDTLICISSATVSITGNNSPFTLSSSGLVTASGTLPLTEGTYQITYQVCETGSSTYCASATATIIVVGLSSSPRANMPIKTVNTISGSSDIIISGELSSYNSVTRNRFARLDGSLNLVSGFGATTNFGPAIAGYSTDLIRSVIIDGNYIYAAGRFDTFNNVSKNRVVKLNLSDGSIASGTFSPVMTGTVYDIKRQGTDKLIAGGYFTGSGTNPTRIARLNADGSYDLTFNNVTVPAGMRGTNAPVHKLAFQNDGKIIVVGSFTSYDNITTLNGYNIKQIIRLSADGVLDTTFNPMNGFGQSINTAENQDPVADKIYVDPSSNKIYMVGKFDYPVDYTQNNFVPTAGKIVRLNADGTVDYNFNYGQVGADNRITDIIPTSTTACTNCFYLTGSFSSYNGTSLGTKARLIRIQQNGSLDTSFNASGTNDFSVPYNNAPQVIVYAGALQTTGKLVLAGDFQNFNNIPVNYITRIAPGGSSIYQTKEAQPDEISLDNNITLFPNPNNGIFNLRFNEILTENTTVEVFNSLGQKVLTKTINDNNEFMLDMLNSASGIYMVKISNSKINLNKSIIKK